MKLQQYIDRRGITATDFAEEAGVSLSTVSRILSGHTLQPRRSTAQKIVKAAEGFVSYSDLWTIEKELE